MKQMAFDFDQVVKDALEAARDHVMGNIDPYDYDNYDELTKAVVDGIHQEFAEQLPRAIYDQMGSH